MRPIIAPLLLVLGVALGVALSPMLVTPAAAADDGGCAAVPENVDLATLQLVRRQLAAMRWEHTCKSLDGAATPEAVGTQANDQARVGWQLVSVTEGGGKAMLCFKRPKVAR